MPSRTWGAARTDGALSILHLDMDSFYVSVEVQRDPSLAGRPVVVGGTGPRGVVASASYEARVFGVRSAMPAVRARQLCPQAVFVPGDHAVYGDVSRRVHDVMREVTDVIEPIALDEAFLDVSAAHARLGDGPAIARHLRTRVWDATGLGCSVGVAAKKLLAKLASEAAKPRIVDGRVVDGAGVHVVPVADELPFLHGHPVQALWGVGPRTLEKLQRLGVRTIGELARLPEPALVASVGDGQGRHLAALARADDPRPVEAEREVKSVSHEETFPVDVDDRDRLWAEVVRLADAVAGRLRGHGVAGRTVTLKLRYPDFRTITRAASGAPLDTAPALLRRIRPVFDAVDLSPGIRLLGVGVSGLDEGDERQLSFDDPADDWTDVSRTVDEIRDRFGSASIGPAAASHRRPFRPGGQQWGPDAE